MSAIPSRLRRARRGFTLLEMTVVLAVLSCALVSSLEVMHVIGSGMKAESTHSDLRTRTGGTMYDIVVELRQATAYSPNFYVEQNAGVPPSITFDLVSGVDSLGNIVWGNKITYRLVQTSNNQTGVNLGIVPGQLLRDETSPVVGSTTVTYLIEENVPYQYTQNGVSNWGFSVSCTGNALTVALSRFGDTSVQTGNVYQDAVVASAATGSEEIVTTKGTYFLRNPQGVISLQ